jgi:accessory gene regulator B
MSLLSAGIARWSVKNGNLKAEQFQIIQFGIAVFLDSFLKIAGLIALGAVFGFLGQVITALLVFSATRYFAGGVHCESHLGCFLSMAAICAAAVALSEFSLFLPVWIVASMLLFSFVSIAIYAPMISRKNPIRDPKVLGIKRKGSLLSVLALGIFIVFCQAPSIKWLLVTPLFIEAMLILPLFKGGKKHDQENNETEAGRENCASGRKPNEELRGKKLSHRSS